MVTSIQSIQEEFISNFHLLTGITIAERRKKLFLLLNTTRQSMEAVKGEIEFSSLQPKTPLEENFKTEALIFFKRTRELLEALKSENPVVIHKILKIPWFIEEVFGNISGGKLIIEVFRNVSYNTKLKILNKLCGLLKDSQRGDEFFRTIKETYGVHLASKLLPACSKAVIVDYLELNRTEVTPRQLLIIIKTYPDLTESILAKLNEYKSKVDVGNKYKCVFRYLMQNNFQLFVTLHEKYNPKITLGSRATTTIISRETQDVIKNPTKYYKFLKKKKISKTLKGDFKSFYWSFFPKSLRELVYNLEEHLTLLAHMSSSEKLKLLTTTFTRVHGNELWDHPEFMKPKLIEMMSPNDRETWMQTHSRPEEIPEETWMSFKKTEKSIPLLKEKISLTSKLQRRVTLFSCLIATCRINNDKKALLSVCEYFLSKHRSDHVTVRQEFLSALNNSFDLSQLGGEYWNYINELLQLFKLNGESSCVIPQITKKYIYYCFENNLPVRDVLTECGQINICWLLPKHERQCLLMINEMIPSFCKESELEDWYVIYLDYVINWNRRHPKEQISLFLNNKAIDCVISRLESMKNVYFALSVAEQCILSNIEKSRATNLFQAFFKNPWYKNQFKVLTWLIKEQPLALLNNIELITQNFLKMRIVHSAFRNWFRNYVHLEIPQKVCEICLNLIKDENESALYVKETAITILSYVMNPKDFLTLVASYCPSSLTTNKKTPKEQEVYKIQKALLYCLKNVVPASLGLESLRGFSKGNLDHKSFFSISNNVAEEKLILFFTTVSKDVIFLRSRALNQTDICNMLNAFVTTEENRNKSLFKGILNFFIRNPRDDSWKLVQENLKALSIDKEALSVLINCQQIPSQYFVRYVMVIWEILENADAKLPARNKRFLRRLPRMVSVTDEGKCNILKAITATAIATFPNHFSSKLIEKHLFKSRELTNVQRAVQAFTARFIIYCASVAEQENHLKFTCAILQDFVKSTWFDLETSVVGRKMVFNFVQEFCSNFLTNKSNNTEVLQKFIASWNCFLKPHEAFDDYLYLHFTLLYLDCVDNERVMLTKLGEKLARFCDSLQNEGFLVMDVFCKIFDMFRFRFCGLEGDVVVNQLMLIENILKNSNSPCCLILVISLLPRNAVMSPKTKVKYDAVMESLLKEPDRVVQIHLDSYLKTQQY